MLLNFFWNFFGIIKTYSYICKINQIKTKLFIKLKTFKMKKLLALCFAIAGIFMFSACVNQPTKEVPEEEVIVAEDSIIVSEPDSTMVAAPDSLTVEVEEEEVIED